MDTVGSVIGRYRPRGIEAPAAAFAKAVVAAAAPAGPARARSLLWACSRLAARGTGVGLEASPEVLLHPSVIERYATVGMAQRPVSARRSARTNLRFGARRVVPERLPPGADGAAPRPGQGALPAP